MNRPESSIANSLAIASEVVQMVDSAQDTAVSIAGKPVGGDPTAAGFGAGVHQYLNQLLTLIYSKTTTLLAANVVLVSLLLSTRSSIKIALDAFYIGSVCFFALSAITSTLVLFPRLRHADNSGGLIFWRAILLEGSEEKYYARVQGLTKADVEGEYARDNYHLSIVIRLKDRLLRCAIAFFILGLISAVVGVVLPMILSHS